MDALGKLLNERSGSPLTDMLAEAPKLIDQAIPLHESTADFSLKSLFGSKAKGVPGPQGTAEVTPDAEPDYIPMTATEMEIKAESKAEMWGAVLAMFFDLLNRLIATQSLRKDDKALVQKYEDETRILGYAPDYDPHHPYFAARVRWDAFSAAISESESDAKLTDYQRAMLKKALKADIEKKNREKQLKAGSIAEALFDIAVSKAGPQGVQFLVTKFSSLSDSIN